MDKYVVDKCFTRHCQAAIKSYHLNHIYLNIFTVRTVCLVRLLHNYNQSKNDVLIQQPLVIIIKMLIQQWLVMVIMRCWDNTSQYLRQLLTALLATSFAPETSIFCTYRSKFVVQNLFCPHCANIYLKFFYTFMFQSLRPPQDFSC